MKEELGGMQVTPEQQQRATQHKVLLVNTMLTHHFKCQWKSGLFDEERG